MLPFAIQQAPLQLHEERSRLHTWSKIFRDIAEAAPQNWTALVSKEEA